MTRKIGPGLRLVFWSILILTGLTGLVMFAMPVLAGETLWPWKLTPLLSRYLGGLFIGVAVGAFSCARATTWSEVRLLFPPGLTFTGLSLVATGIHFASFNPERLATWVFFGLYSIVFVAGLLAYLWYERAQRVSHVPASVLSAGGDAVGHERPATA
jgi:hypothetical protein